MISHCRVDQPEPKLNRKKLHSEKTYVSRDIYEVITEPESESNDEDSENEYSQFRYKCIRQKARKDTTEKPISQANLHENKHKASNNQRNQKENEIQDEGDVNKVSRKERGKTVIIGDSQLHHHIDESSLSGRNNKTLVRSKGGLKIQEVSSVFRNIPEEDADEIVIYVGVNNVEKESEDEVIRKYLGLSNSVTSARITFSSVIKEA